MARGLALQLATLEWIDRFNQRRLFGAIGYVPPAEFERTCYSGDPRPAIPEDYQTRWNAQI